ncbi:4-hydroxybenzoate octaprenyltransferase [Aureliella helgolandensis]|uniref:4-hydroxybenzoate polyprenyltransferase n=1 Tax=Aureliella helgolandensis TaxID=2527968 RepID=A0A518G0M8_9BACT|nr:4-hydroxybenzoate octaprenyltransferase [Aureliella helgolandensis]QDV22159.1 4-hydroxybenzoate octaprenyltransferase [Aureliella helgolandensis]
MDSTSTQNTPPEATAGAQQPTSLCGRFLGLIRFSHTVFALPFAALACVLALSVPNPLPSLPGAQIASRLLGVLACMVFARSAAMAFNRLVDAKIDAANPRTASRHLPAGLLSARQAWSFFALMCLGFFASCGLFLPNWLPLALSVPVLLWICGYSLAKRFTSAAHAWLGIALAMSPICAWIALRGEACLANPADVMPAVWLALAIAFWVAGFDIIYACQDADFDRSAGLRSIPASLGVVGALRLSAAFHLAMLVVLGALPQLAPQLALGWLYYSALLVVTVLIIRQHAIVSPNDLGRINIAFFNINAMISFCLSLAMGIDAWLR